ncbi:MAG: hypothetical protein ACYCR7_02885 [Thermoplasmataceae archaeon]
MRIFADGIITLTVFTSLTFYESITEPKCLTRIVTPAMNYAIINYTELAFLIQEGDTGAFLNSYNYSYLGNTVELMDYTSIVGGRHVNITNLEENGQCGDVGFIFRNLLWIGNESMNSQYSNLVVSITNMSLSINKPFFKNATSEKNDSFGTYGKFYPEQDYPCLYSMTLQETNWRDFTHPGYPPFYTVINPGNYTFYLNITLTITVSESIVHFTSQTYSIDMSWWQKWGYNLSQFQ